MWKRYHSNEEHTPKLKTEGDVQVFHSAETVDKAPALNIFKILVQAPFVENDQDYDNKINNVFLSQC